MLHPKPLGTSRATVACRLHLLLAVGLFSSDREVKLGMTHLKMWKNFEIEFKTLNSNDLG